uniref:Uncharacterized protein n=1 Tax=Schistosoma haematobium TaxID=6185 RepID=A0A094ZQL5_SCHHA
MESMKELITPQPHPSSCPKRLVIFIVCSSWYQGAVQNSSNKRNHEEFSVVMVKDNNEESSLGRHKESVKLPEIPTT